VMPPMRCSARSCAWRVTDDLPTARTCCRRSVTWCLLVWCQSYCDQGARGPGRLPEKLCWRALRCRGYARNPGDCEPPFNGRMFYPEPSSEGCADRRWLRSGCWCFGGQRHGCTDRRSHRCPWRCGSRCYGCAPYEVHDAKQWRWSQPQSLAASCANVVYLTKTFTAVLCFGASA
jgi:hypothetical protein